MSEYGFATLLRSEAEIGPIIEAATLIAVLASSERDYTGCQ